ncbi:hypothetical protein FXF61_03540 [Pseudomonas sp. C27(2019)]|uniref:CsiV family protein n=1 Tax=Pseudomonas sp. C27(2019) TaxID=2604941 RepID=UPI001245A110|nr:CsiV family protein [Pseudomonas sp. C27(2019)]QEY58300.1 hypothetical protein FXF61_03540 [Pseudomonas sp. C27(2019)]
MRYLIIHFVLLFSLGSAQAFATESQLVELIVFQQNNDSLQSSRVAPDNWANGATRITADMLRSTQLDLLAKKLTPDNGYQVIMHKAWLQNNDGTTAQVAISDGPAYFQHFPIEGTLSFELERTSSVQLDLWINQFNTDKTLRSSQRFKQKTLVANGQVTYVDSGSLGALIRIQAQQSTAQPQPDQIQIEPEQIPQALPNPEDFE